MSDDVDISVGWIGKRELRRVDPQPEKPKSRSVSNRPEKGPYLELRARTQERVLVHD